MTSGFQEEPGATLGEYLWCRPYIQLVPDTCFVLDDGNGEAVGYSLSVPDPKVFADRWRKDFIPTLPDDMFPKTSKSDDDSSAAGDTKKDTARPFAWMIDLARDPEKAANLDKPDLLETYPGHLHIDILPEYQGKGYGPKLIQALFEGLRERGCRGVHLCRSGANVRAGRFYERIGLQRWDKVLDEGKSGEKGTFTGWECLSMSLDWIRRE